MDFPQSVEKREAIIKALNRMVVAGKISKLARGKYYKPETSIFGVMKPPQYQIVKDLVESDGKPVGYLTGFSIFNQLGLTTQVSFTLQIGKNQIRPALKREQYRIAFIRQKNTITRENIPLLQILDCIRFIRKIPDTPLDSVCRRLLFILKDLPESDKKSMVRLALKYPPVTRSVLGLFFEELGANNLADTLRKTLNPITVYRLPGIKGIYPSAAKWNLK